MIKNVITFVCLLFVIQVNAQFSLSDKGASVGYVIKDISSGELIAGNLENQRLISASLLKIVTTSTALEVLGKDYTFKTEVGYSGSIENGVLNGDLLIKPGYDPTFGSVYFDKTKSDVVFDNIIRKIKKEGISSINGSITILKAPEVPFSSARLWEDMGNYYGGIPHAFNWSDNTCVLTIESGDVGDTCNIINVTPSFTPYQIKSYVISATHHKDSAYVYGIRNMKDWWVEGSIPANKSGFKVKAAMPDPEFIFKRDLEVALKENSIAVHHFSEEKLKPGKWFYTIESPVLSEIIKVTNHKSNNLFADALLLAMGKDKTGMVSWEAGIKVISDFWKDKTDFQNSFRMKDGSGLSPKTLVTPKGMVDILIWMKQNSKQFDVFKNSLAIGGVNGTLKSVFKEKGVKGNVLGKSGSMEGVLGYCGYIHTNSKRSLVFCVISNNFMIPFKETRYEMDHFISSFVENK